MRRNAGLLLLLLLLFLGFNSYSQVMECALVEIDSVNPKPVNGHYSPGETVTFCYSLQGFQQWGSNWVCGFVLKFGAGWDTTTLVPLDSPGSCDGAGVWGFYDSCVSTGTHKKFGQGFYYDRSYSGPSRDSIPGNNLGDYTVTGSCIWSLCFSIKVKDAPTSKDLSVFVTATGDGTCGSWDSPGQYCAGIPFSLLPDTITTGTKSVFGNSAVTVIIYPNYTSDKAFVSLNLTSPTKVIVKIIDMTGKTEETFNSDQISPGKQIIEISAGNLSAGMYIVNIQMEKYYVNQKFVVVK